VLVMVQAEVADRLAAPPGNRTYGIPSVKAAWYATARRTSTIGRNVFWPVPNVDSALVLLERRAHPQTRATRERVFEVVDAAFAQRRKMLRGALAELAGSAAAAAQALEAAGVDPTTRGEQLTVDDFARIAEALDDQAGTAGTALVDTTGTAQDVTEQDGTATTGQDPTSPAGTTPLVRPGTARP